MFRHRPRRTRFPYTTLFRSVAKVARQSLGAEKFVPVARPSMGGEDFAYYLEKIPGCFFLVGVERSEEHTSELQSLRHLVCRLLLEKKKQKAKLLEVRYGSDL